MQEQNSAVLKGDTIISGIVENRDGGMSLRRASGYVTALTKHAFSTESRPLPSRKISEIKSRYTLLFFSLKVPLGAQTDADFTEDRFLTLGGVKLPIGIRAERNIFSSPRTRRRMTSPTSLRSKRIFIKPRTACAIC